MPYLTPQELPETDDCRSLSIPADTEWLAFFGGVLTELTKAYNWEYSGGLTVDETVAKMQEIVDAYYESVCGGCELPEGGKIIRIGEHGILQELGDDGSWHDGSGDYDIPPPDARTGGTPPDQICLAATNAVSVLQQLYDSLSDSWNSELNDAEAETAFTLTLIGLVGFEFAPITFGIIAFFGVVFGILYQALEYLGADLWTDDFTQQMICFLDACGTNTGGVVTFDWDCLMGKLNSLVDSFGLSEVQIRLYLQVTYMLYFIGGIDGLNLAGGTTAIETADCSPCDNAWCYDFDFATTGEQQDWAPFFYPDGWTGTGWGATDMAGARGTAIQRLLAETVITHVQMNWTGIPGGASNAVIWLYLGGVEQRRVDLGTWLSGGNSFAWDDVVLADEIRVSVAASTDSSHVGSCDLFDIEVHGTGTNPFGEDNCIIE